MHAGRITQVNRERWFTNLAQRFITVSRILVFLAKKIPDIAVLLTDCGI
jgi:hypothetical protein